MKPSSAEHTHVDIFDQAKNIIEYLAHGIEFAAAPEYWMCRIGSNGEGPPTVNQPWGDAVGENEARLTLGRWLTRATRLRFRRVAGLEMLVQTGAPSARRAVHLIFADEKVRDDYPEAVPEFGPYRTIRGMRVIPLSGLIRMKLTSFRLKDQTHLKDLDEAGLITPEIEHGLSPMLRARLMQVRSHE